MNRYVLAVAAGSLLGVLIEVAFFVLILEHLDGRTEPNW